MTFLLLVYCFTGARVGAFLDTGKGLDNGKEGAEQGADENEKVIFQGLTWKVGLGRFFQKFMSSLTVC